MGTVKSRLGGSVMTEITDLANREACILLVKELRQAMRTRGALLTGLLVPIGMLLLAPAQIVFSARHATPADLYAISHLELPVFTVICGLVVPALTAVYIFVNERERRSLELLLASPVRVRDIFVAKLGAAFVLSAGVTLPLLALQSGVVLWDQIDDIRGVAMRAMLLVAALTCSLGFSLLVALFARDFRTTNNLAGALLLPMMLVTLTLLQVSRVTLFGHIWAIPVALDDRPILLAAIMVTVGVAAAAGALRHVTFERYLA